MKVAIIGAGISGLAVANMLNELGYDISVYESETIPGGLVKCTREEGVLFHRVGGHVFNSKNKEIIDWFSSKFNLEEDFKLSRRNARIWLGNQIIGYPIENYIYKLSTETVSKIIEELIAKNQKQETNHRSFENFEGFLKNNFGRTLFDLYFGPYNTKIWNTDLKDIPLDWLNGKLPMPNITEIIVNNILRADESKMVHSSFFYPKNDGSQFIINRLTKKINLKLNSHINTISLEQDNSWTIMGDKFNAIIYTGDVRKLKSSFIGCDDLNHHLDGVAGFKSNGTSNVLCEIDKCDLSWMYLPEPHIKPHRIIYTGNFSRSNNGAKKRLTCTIEFSGIYNENQIVSELKKIPGNPLPIAFNIEANSYIVHDRDTASKIKRLKSELERKHFYLLGRFAEWEYYNMDKAIEAGINLTRRCFKN